jgi:diguanylate cyclase (GGDEF)-like protein
MHEDPPSSSDDAHRESTIPGVEETAYTWHIAQGRIDWEPNAAVVLGMDDIGQIATAAGFESRLLPDHAGRWHRAIQDATASGDPAGEPYQVQYGFRSNGGGHSDLVVWLEDTGHWWPDAEGRPSRVRGKIRVVDARLLDEPAVALNGHAGDSALSEQLNAAIGRAASSRQTSAFMIAAVSNLSMINASFGIIVGNEVVAAVAGILRSELKDDGTLTVYASNKFGIILERSDAEAMRRTSARLIEAIRNARIATSTCIITATIAIGGVLVPDQAQTAALAMAHALDALGQARLEQTDSFVAFEREINDTRRRNIAVANGVVSALDEGRMHFVLQPIIEAETGKPAMYECLLRMTRPDGSVASAGEFIHVAEQLGMARKIDMHTLELAVALLARHPRLMLSVNVSGFTANDNAWAEALHRLTGNRREMTQRLMVEITETAMIHDLGRMSAFVDMLRDVGCTVAIDDFGAGYTSFSHLKKLRVDVLKIDGAFVKDLPNDHQGRVLIKSMIELAKAFGLKTIAEWVGDAQTAQFLRDAGVTYLQGFLYGLPIAVEELPPPA